MPGTKGKSYKTPKDIVVSCMNTALIKAGLRWERIVGLGFLAGAYIALGGVLATILTASMDQQPGIEKLVAGAVFPVGLMCVLIAGGGLYTGNTAIMTPSWLSGRITLYDMLRNWSMLWFANFAGAFCVAYFLAYESGLFDEDPFRHTAIKIAKKKMELKWGQVFLRGIGCNWLVCLAVWLAYAADDIAGKVLGIWFPTMAFVAIGYDHCIANMYYLSLGLMLKMEGDDKYFFKDAVWNNLIPATLGNTIGGGFFVGTLYWFAYIYEFGDEKRERANQAADAPTLALYSEVDGALQTDKQLPFLHTKHGHFRRVKEEDVVITREEAQHNLQTIEENAQTIEMLKAELAQAKKTLERKRSEVSLSGLSGSPSIGAEMFISS
mmetsp:Transcript_34440/g.75321  ORF Transcript_34440/g.75321 Transcript_34440/m.75321 type:complete len:380 (-) Transcript_34440:166-1305(-)